MHSCVDMMQQNKDMRRLGLNLLFTLEVSGDHIFSGWNAGEENDLSCLGTHEWESQGISEVNGIYNYGMNLSNYF